MTIGRLNFSGWGDDTSGISSPLSDALHAGLKTYGDITGLQQGNADVEAKKFANKISEAKAQYAQPMAQAELQKAQAEPALVQAQTAYQKALASGVPSEIAARYAQIAYQKSDLELKKTALPYENKLKEAQADYYAHGGGSGSTGSQDDSLYQSLVAKDNPNLTPQQAREAANVLSLGGNKLSNGTPINPMGADTRRAFDRTTKSGTTSKLVTSGVQANQADAELKAMSDFVSPVAKEVGTTYFNKSPEVLMASFSNKPEDQKKLGRIIGARSVQYAMAQLRNRIDMGEPGISATKELMDNSGQIVDITAPRLTPAAREEAVNFVNEAVVRALKARNSYGIGASAASGTNQAASSENVVKWVRKDGKLIRQ